MKPVRQDRPAPTDEPPARSRRGVLLGAGAAAAAGAVAVLAVRGQAALPDTAATAQARAEDDAPGYRLSEHVRRYYETART